jgi:hypothetical protein
MKKRKGKYESTQQRILACSEPDENGCWIWKLKPDNWGYGMSYHADGKQDKAHRVSYAAFVDEIPKGKSVLHSCDVRNCVNYDHLRVGTAKDNMQDAKERGRLHGARKKLTEEQKKQMRILKANGATKSEIAAEFGVSQRVVQVYWKDSNNGQ